MTPWSESSSITQFETVKSLAATAEYNYRNYSTIKAVLGEIADSHPSIAQIHDIGDSWEKTEGLADRDILALKISDNVAVEEDEPEVLIMALHHAREWPTSELVTAVAENLTAGYGVDARISWLVDNRQIWLVPVVNPDGLDYALETDDSWRKNRRLNYDDTYGVDINRNYNGSENGDPDGAWGGDGTSHNPGDQTYCGESPFSEPETQAIRDLVLAHDFEVATDFHTYGDSVMWPWSYTEELAPDNDDLVRIGCELALLNGYLPMQGIYLYATTGDSTDWLYGAADIYAYCIEVGNEDAGIWQKFHPLEYDTVMSLINENLPVSFEIMEIAGDRQERGIDIYHNAVPEREYTESGFEIVAAVLAERGVNTTAQEVTYRIDGGDWASVPMVQGPENDTYAATIPSQELGSVVEYYIYAEDLGGFPLTSPRYAPYELHSFEVVPDSPTNLPPTITHEPRTADSVNDTLLRPDVGVLIYAVITDDGSIASAYLHHRPLGSDIPFESSWMYSPWDNSDFSGLVASGYEGGLEYYIEATDDDGVVALAPDSAPGSFFTWYNLPPSVDSVSLPDVSSGFVEPSQAVTVKVTVSDDYGATGVVLSVEYEWGESYDVDMVLVSEDAGVSEWTAEIVARSEPGAAWLNLTASDGLLSGWRNGTLLCVTVPPPLEMELAIPSEADGSFDIVIAAVPHNATPDMAFRLCLVDDSYDETHTYPFAAIDDALLQAVIPAGSVLGRFTAVAEAVVGTDAVWSSDGFPIEVVDLQAPEMVNRTTDYGLSSMLLFMNVTASDAYSVTGVEVFHRLAGQTDFSSSEMELVLRSGNESSWTCEMALPLDSVLEYYLVLSDGTNSERLPDAPSLYTYGPVGDGAPEEEHVLGLPVWAFAALSVGAVVAAVVVLILVSRARRS